MFRRILLKKWDLTKKALTTTCKMPTLLKYGTDLTAIAKEGKFDPIIGRKQVIKNLTEILCCRTNNNPCLIGNPGVGKSTIVKGLAMQIANRTCPEILAEKKIFSVDMDRLVADTSNTAEFNKSLIKLLKEVKESEGAIILFINDLHRFIEYGKPAYQAETILNSALARGELTCIGAISEEYEDYIDTDSVLGQRFQAVEVPESSNDEAIEILKGLRHKYESHHGVKYTDVILRNAVDLSKEHISDRYLPDKAIKLIDKAGARVKLYKTNTIVTKKDIRQLVIKSVEESDEESDEEPAEKSVEKVSDEEAIRLLGMEKTFQLRLIGQDEAISAVSRAIRRSRVGLRDQDQPIATFLFTGPTGVGKTELAKLLSVEFFKSKEAMVRLDMSEYMEEHTVSRLFGSPPGYLGHNEGGQLTGQVRERPDTVVLFDEIEKAHPKVFNVLLQILDDGRLTDGKGKTTDFTNTIIIMTSNIGGQVTGGNQNEVKTEVESQLSKVFKPEFLNRIDEVIVFQPLQEAQARTILDVMLVDFCKKVEKMNIHIEISNNMKDKLLSEGFNPKYGARPLKRAITKLLEDKLAEKILSGGLKDCNKATVDVDSNGEVVIINS